jgi:Fe-S cluster biosynthesis and repair protein YggX
MNSSTKYILGIDPAYNIDSGTTILVSGGKYMSYATHQTIVVSAAEIQEQAEKRKCLEEKLQNFYY